MTYNVFSGTLNPTHSLTHSHDVILIVTSFATELATPTDTDERRTYVTDTLSRLIYKDYNSLLWYCQPY